VLVEAESRQPVQLMRTSTFALFVISSFVSARLFAVELQSTTLERGPHHRIVETLNDVLSDGRLVRQTNRESPVLD
jgi:hypothetical protein